MGRFAIFRGLLFFAILAVLALPAYTIFFFSPSVYKFMSIWKEEQAVRIAEHMESKIIPNQNRLEREMLTEDVLNKITGTSRDFHLVKVRIFFPSGELLYSSAPSDREHLVSREIIDVLREGRAVSKTIPKGTAAKEGELMPSDVVETYAPIIRENQLIGGFEIYYDITADKARVKKMLWGFNLTLFPIVFGLLGALWMSYLKVKNNIMKRQEAEEELLKKSAELQDKNEDLAELFIICKERQRRLQEEQQARLAAQQQVQEELIKRDKLRQELLRHTVQAQEEERARIARELHDETAQTLTAASLNFATLKNFLEGRMPEVADLVTKLQNLCRQMNRDLYRLVHDLRPAQLDDLGLVPALQYLVDEGQANTKIKVVLQLGGEQKRLEPFVETVIFRIVQEALTNVARHAETDQASVELNYEADRAILRIRDQGKGFDPDRDHASLSGWGLIGMAERAESINGRFLVDSSPGKGTMVEVIIPYECGLTRATQLENQNRPGGQQKAISEE